MTGEEWLQQKRREGALITEGQVGASGWGKAAFSRGGPAHHWTRTTDLGEGSYGYRSACGQLTVSTPRVPLFGAGNYPFCTRCENALMKAMKP